jgi:hypothetical protein
MNNRLKCTELSKAYGNKTVLDAGTTSAIPPSSLALDGHVAKWTHSGEQKSATLSG